MDWMIIVLVIVGMVASLITCQQLGKDEMIAFPHEILKLIKLFKKEKKIKYLILFLVDIIDSMCESS